MHPVMKVNKTFIDNKAHYELVLSRENFNHLSAGCPDADHLVGYSPGGAYYFCIFPNSFGEISEFFKPMPDGSGYFACVGAPVPNLPQGVNGKEFDRLAKQAADDLEKAINESGKIPIREVDSLGGWISGYVMMRVEKETSIAP